MNRKPVKPLAWVANSLKDMRAMPDEVKRFFGVALFMAQAGDKHPDAKPLKGFIGSGVLEIVEDYDGNTYRAIYTVRFADAVYVLHVFQKKSKTGIATPQPDIEKIKARLKMVEEQMRNTGRK
jgi:phage-related protein